MLDRLRPSRRHLLGLMASAAATPLWAQGFAGLGQDAEGFAMPARGRALRFPRDHGPHPDFRIEWWYVTANLRTASGADCGVQWTLFRSALRPEITPADGWASPQIWFAHAAMTRATEHLVAERRARGGIGHAGAEAAPFAAWIDDWAMTGHAAAGSDAHADPLSRLSLRARGAGWSYDLALAAEGPLVLHGQDGFSLKHERGQASHYYSQPGYQVSGTLHWPDGPEPVSGVAWLDREWSSQPLDADQTGWDWFSLHLDGGAKLMVYQLREAAGDGYLAGTWIAADGSATALDGNGIGLDPLARTEIDGRPIPTRWRLTLPERAPERAMDITVAAVNPRAWMGTGIAYWEGPVEVAGSHTGRGYLEMTGYDG